jgi:hypothetical protein
LARSLYNQALFSPSLHRARPAWTLTGSCTHGTHVHGYTCVHVYHVYTCAHTHTRVHMARTRCARQRDSGRTGPRVGVRAPRERARSCVHRVHMYTHGTHGVRASGMVDGPCPEGAGPRARSRALASLLGARGDAVQGACLAAGAECHTKLPVLPSPKFGKCRSPRRSRRISSRCRAPRLLRSSVSTYEHSTKSGASSVPGWPASGSPSVTPRVPDARSSRAKVTEDPSILALTHGTHIEGTKAGSGRDRASRIRPDESTKAHKARDSVTGSARPRPVRSHIPQSTAP